MSKQLIEEIMQLEAEAEEQLTKAGIEAEAIIRRAQEQAILLVQETEHSLDVEQEAALKQRTQQLEAEKARAIQDARSEAQALAQTLQKKVPKAAAVLHAKFMESADDVS